MVYIGQRRNLQSHDPTAEGGLNAYIEKTDEIRIR